MNLFSRYCCLFLLLLSIKLHAQEIKIETSMDMETLQLGQTIEVVYTYPSNIQTSLRILGNNYFKLLDTTYRVDAAMELKICTAKFLSKQVGKLPLPKATITSEGRIYSSEVMNVVVQKKTSKSTAQAGDASDNFFDDVAVGPTSVNAKKQSDTVEYRGNQIFAQLELNKTSPFVGEQVTLSSYLYSLRPLDLKGLKPPKLDGFWVYEDTTSDLLLNYEVVKLKGSSYYRYPLFKTVLFPFAAGEVRIPSIAMTCFADVELDAADKGGDASLANMFKLKALSKQYVKLNSNSVLLSVKKLPDDNTSLPVDLVGKYQLKNNQAEVTDLGNGTYEMILQIEGSGNLKFVSIPLMQQNEDWDMSEPVVVDSFSLKDGQVSGVRKISFTLSSTKEGANAIPEFSIKYFDPSTQQYNVLKIDRQEMKSIQHADVVAKEEGLHDINTQSQLDVSESVSNYTNRNYWLAYSLPLAILLGGVVFKKVQLKRSVRRKYFEAKTNALKRIEVAQSLLAVNNVEAYYNGIYNALWTYVKDKFMVHHTGMNEEFVLQLFTAKKVATADLDRFVQINHACQMRLYGSNVSSEVSSALSLQLKDLIINLDNHFDAIQKS